MVALGLQGVERGMGRHAVRLAELPEPLVALLGHPGDHDVATHEEADQHTAGQPEGYSHGNSRTSTSTPRSRNSQMMSVMYGSLMQPVADTTRPGPTT